MESHTARVYSAVSAGLHQEAVGLLRAVTRVSAAAATGSDRGSRSLESRIVKPPSLRCCSWAHPPIELPCPCWATATTRWKSLRRRRRRELLTHPAAGIPACSNTHELCWPAPALCSYGALCAAHPTIPEYCMYWCQSLLKVGLLAEAARASAGLPVGTAAALLTCAIRFEQGDLKGCQQALELMLPAEPAATVNLGCLLYKESQWAAAAAQFTEGLQVCAGG